MLKATLKEWWRLRKAIKAEIGGVEAELARLMLGGDKEDLVREIRHLKEENQALTAIVATPGRDGLHPVCWKCGAPIELTLMGYDIGWVGEAIKEKRERDVMGKDGVCPLKTNDNT